MRRINKPQHIRQTLAEQINILQSKEDLQKTDMDRARTIAYVSSIALTAMKDGELEERISKIEESLKENEQ